MIADVAVAGIAPRIIDWQRLAGRHDLPWQRVDPARAPLRDPYRVWLSEVMLQQTQVITAMPYFEAFLAAFPTVADLAAAPVERVMARWSGLGYYSRARNLHAAARRIIEHHAGRFPDSAPALAELPGVGRSTAAAIAVFAFGERAAILDGNVKRVFSRVFAVDGSTAASATMARLWAHAEAELPAAPASAADLIDYTQGLMDLGATCCARRQPDCGRCPLAGLCEARSRDAIDRYPAARPRKVVPVREADLLLVAAAGRTLVQMRPARGIWGGLESLPELQADGPDLATQADVLLATAGFERAGDLEPCARLDHTFTHFRLLATVWRADIAVAGEAPLPPAAGFPGGRWLTRADVDDAPLPGPIKRLLRDDAGLFRLQQDRPSVDHRHPGPSR